MTFLFVNIQAYTDILEILFNQSELYTEIATQLYCQAFAVYFYALQYPHAPLLWVNLAFFFRLLSMVVTKLNLLLISYDAFLFALNAGWQDMLVQNAMRSIRYQKETDLKSQIQKVSENPNQVSRVGLHNQIIKGYKNGMATLVPVDMLLNPEKEEENILKLTILLKYMSLHRDLYADLLDNN